MRLHVFVVVLGMLVAGSTSVVAQGYGDYDYDRPSSAGLTAQLQTARTHATNAARSDVLRDAKWHLGHVVNCLEGARGRNYDRQNSNPCQGQGNGILPDLEAATRSGQRGAMQALDLARDADQTALATIALTDLAQIKGGASKVADLLGRALALVGQ